MAKTPKQQEAADRYLREKVDEIKIRVPKGRKGIIKTYTEAHGESVNGFINRAIEEAMARGAEKQEKE